MFLPTRWYIPELNAKKKRCGGVGLVADSEGCDLVGKFQGVITRDGEAVKSFMKPETPGKREMAALTVTPPGIGTHSRSQLAEGFIII